MINVIMHMFRQFNLNDCLLTITTDNASFNETLQKYFNNLLQK